ncbi:MAG: hypothetical protein OFPII_08900 [Osedax symbiont Rs1]|nr:MAG: hypothetical protein OFPII_08900 [Osedax symbiont Rs1]
MQKYIHTQSDEYGDLAVIDDGQKGQYRILSFAVGDEQSIQLKSEPHILQHPYTQAMMLSLLFCQPKSVLLLGLGAGSLLSSLHHNVAGVRITAVELRQSVIDIAIRYFRLPSSKKISVICDDAAHYLQQPAIKKVDLIMSDLYNDEGMDKAQVSTAYLDACLAQLKVNGWLVLNCWDGAQEQPSLLAYLKKSFADVRTCESGDGNVVIIAGRQKDLKSASELKKVAVKLSLKLEFNLQPYLSNLVLK